ncbi:aldose epimerase family protein [Pannonibacter tanglangensis]|uniref:Aldose 1-epimerase n=1 Tax=Pannonibacter tanglangensis TaxID=2750084 RepID=A0ABW9ZII8_9HYPH|nr:aldose epimerase family protein [Pannonibacter sp. XCT-34]NBN64673.1 galactose-1-epimerase [Pannonibacter sp. XCT-34]
MIRPFGTLHGVAVDEVTLRAGSLEACILTYGATLRDLRLAGRPLVLGLLTLEDYLTHGAYFGALCGRYANRIAGGRFSLDGVAHQVTCNERGRTHLHGGATGFDKRIWTVEELASDAVLLSLVSPDGEEGFPGTVTLKARFRLLPSAVLSLTVTAVTDAPTLVNIAHHSYFNLDGSADVLGHRLQIMADHYLPVDALGIPTGEVAPVAGTAFDFRTLRGVAGPRTYDHTFCLAPEPVAEPQLAAVLEGASSGVSMELWTTEPGLQLYDAAGLGLPQDGPDGRRFGPHAGLCLEPQRWPDSPNRPQFAGAVLRPGRTYHQVTEFRFHPGD